MFKPITANNVLYIDVQFLKESIMKHFFEFAQFSWISVVSVASSVTVMISSVALLGLVL